MRIAKSKQTVTDYHANASISATTLLVGGGNGSKHVVGIQRIVLETIQLTGEDIEQNFGIRGRVNVATPLLKQLFAQFVGVSQITIVRQRNAKR